MYAYGGSSSLPRMDKGHHCVPYMPHGRPEAVRHFLLTAGGNTDFYRRTHAQRFGVCTIRNSAARLYGSGSLWCYTNRKPHEPKKRYRTMARYNPDFWEVQSGPEFLDNLPAERALWYESPVDRERRHALKDFYQAVLPVIEEIIDSHLTSRQREVLRLYYFEQYTQEAIAKKLQVTQSTVSRHLFGTVRKGKRMGGALPKLREAVEKEFHPRVSHALAHLRQRFSRAV